MSEGSQQSGVSSYACVLGDSLNGYTWHFAVYRGKEGETVSVNGLSYDVIMQMGEGLQNRGYVFYTDNFYSSPTLFKDWSTMGLELWGQWIQHIESIQMF